MIDKTVVHVSPEDVCGGLARQFCSECYEKHVESIDSMREEYLRLRRVLMFERALAKLEKQSINLYEYKDVIEQMQEYVENTPDKFDSAQEVVAAIILVGHGIKCKVQYPVGKYVADFYLPELKVVLEIDGERHKYSTGNDRKRDVVIRGLLGEEWEVIRIPTEHIDKNAKELVSAILSIKGELKKIRAMNGGVIPEWYSKRHKAKRRKKATDDEL